MSSVKFPKNIIEPIKQFLHLEEQKLNRRKMELEEQDPFKDPKRVTDNACVDTEAAEQFGHATIEGLKREIDRKLVQVRKALTWIKLGKYGACEKCGKMIDTDRLMVFPEVTICVECEKKKES